jgi:poly(hydroxyalkanoate) depolymerase family esterase
MDINNRMTAAMAEATRLTRAGRLLEATALVQHTLRGMPAQEASSNATACTDEPIDASFRVVDATLCPTTSSPVGSPPRSEAVMSPPEPGDASTERTAPDKDGDSGVCWPIHDKRQSDGGESIPIRHRWHARFRSMLRLRRSGLGQPKSSPISDGARREIWAGGQYIEGSYTNPAGTRAYKLYIPSRYKGQALPLVVMLHGCTQSPDDFAAGTRMNVLAERELFFVLYPAQAAPANPSKCWNWFQTTDQQRGHGEPCIIAGLTHQICSTYHLNARRVYVVGLSAGGAMAAIMGMAYPDLYAAMGVHSGLAYGAAQDLPSAHAAMQHGGVTATRQRDSRASALGICPWVVPTIVFHGDQDTTVHPSNADEVLAQWATIDSGDGPDTNVGMNLRVTVNRGEVPDGHVYTRSIYHNVSGHAVMEQWLVHGAGHGWSGGSPHGSFTDPKGPDASREMIRFFSQHPQSRTN